jgi:excisionase family DNA binding protein
VQPDILLFDVITDEDFAEDKYLVQRENIRKSVSCNNEQLEELLNNMDDLYKIVRYKHSLSTQLQKESIHSIVVFLEEHYYNHKKLVNKANNILRCLFIPVYYKDKEEYVPCIPQDFWVTMLGKMIISSLSTNDDILLSTSEVCDIIGCKRQNINAMVKNGKLPARKVGGNLVFRLMDVLDYKNK